MKGKGFLKGLLFPPVAVLLVLLPVSAFLLVYAMVWVGTETALAYVSYLLAAYTLTVWCVRAPALARRVCALRMENKYVKRWFEDARLRVNVSLYGSLAWNVAYAALQIGLGFTHRSFWFFSMAAYYISLAVMRFFLARYTVRERPGENRRAELVRARACGWICLVMNFALALMVFFMVYWDRTFRHHEITTIAMAAYTFTAFAVAVADIIKFRKYNSPVFSATKAIGLAAACVSMLTLESTMLTTFGDGTMPPSTRKALLGVSGAVISGCVIAMAVYMIFNTTKQIRRLNEKEN